ncbi:hypothetical protein Ahy_A01g001871 [Arachis hypogaea]|uniref:Transposase MuDR plant domain-containing protein n=1 Tax=Arachis hypogaea TaxID=3818 RepID=A0A445EPL6_ARAHY|nr:hypothetical protein Ahy_A01g001871 [Arachis hypogaea]
MEDTANLVVYRDGEIIHNTHDGVRFVCQNPFSFVVPCTMMLMKLQNGLCQSMKNEAEGIQNDLKVEDDRAAVYEGMNSDIEEDFEATYEAGDEDEDGAVGVETAAENIMVHPSICQPLNVAPFMRELDLEAMHVLEFPEYSNIGAADPEGGEFRIGMEYSSRKSVVTAIKSYTIARGIDYDVYESEPQTFYAKCKMCERRCDWLIRASLIRKKGCWEIRRYNGRHTCTMGVISQDHSKLDSDTVAEAIRPLVKTDPSIKVYRFEFTPIGDPKTWPAYEGPTLVGNPTLRRMSKGHAKLTRYLNEMDSRDMRGPRLCRLSGAQGHSRSRCPQRARPSGAGE